MAIGDIIYNNFIKYIDEITGAEVIRLTEPNRLSHHMYFYNRMTTKDGSKLLYCAEINEERQLYLMDLQSGEAHQLTQGDELDDYGGVISADDKYIFYQQKGGVWKQNLDTFKKELVYLVPQDYSGSGWGMSDDNRYLAIVETKVSTLPERKKGTNWDFFAITCRAKPHCRIVYVDLLTGNYHTVIEDDCWFGHAQIRPGDPNTILFCHEGPYDLIDARLWVVQSDGSNYRCLKEQPSDLIITHEFWVPDGSKVAFVYRETTGDKTENIRLVTPDTMEEEILMPCSPFAHFICDKKNTFMVGDAQGSDVPIHLLSPEKCSSDHEIKNDFIYLIDVAKKTERKLCYHGTSWKAIHGTPQDSHPHPCFTEDNRYVIFVSDREGKPCIYRIDLNQFVN
jgi:oligogalacturonide lyase